MEHFDFMDFKSTEYQSGLFSEISADLFRVQSLYRSLRRRMTLSSETSGRFFPICFQFSRTTFLAAEWTSIPDPTNTWIFSIHRSST